MKQCQPLQIDENNWLGKKHSLKYYMKPELMHATTTLYLLTVEP